MEFICDYMKNAPLRHSLNTLTRNTFGFDFEKWVVRGYFAGDYIPYSFIENGEMLANVSANKMHFIQNGVKRYYIQIGTVMTALAYRRRGLAMQLIKRVVDEYKNECDGIYLFANLEALGFYRKAGFAEDVFEYSCTLKPGIKPHEQGCQLFTPAQGDAAMQQKYMDTLKSCAINSALEQTNRRALQLFYTADMDNVYYSKDIDCFAVISKNGAALTLESIACPQELPLERVIARIPFEYDKLLLGFTPRGQDAALFNASPYDGADDYRLFYIGDKLKSIAAERLFFPLMSHA